MTINLIVEPVEKRINNLFNNNFDIKVEENKEMNEILKGSYMTLNIKDKNTTIPIDSLFLNDNSLKRVLANLLGLEVKDNENGKNI